MIKELEALHLTPAERNTPVVGGCFPGLLEEDPKYP